MLSGDGEITGLRSQLDLELQRLGIDPHRKAAAAPSSGNAVFDLSAELLDADGPGPGEAVAVILRWHERLVGDYDCNGLVSAADLTPLALNFNRRVTYLSPAQTAGIEWWPEGNAESDGLPAGAGDPLPPPVSGSGAYNWASARVDGNADGVVNAQDVTAIALHWKERLDGYRVYRRAPGESSFTLLPDPGDAGAALSVGRGRAEHAYSGSRRPARYEFVDSLSANGPYEYYVAAYDSQSGAEGPASAAVTARLNTAPEARITASTQLGDAPLSVQFMAGSSTDADGDLLSFEWDLDGDGSFELGSGRDPDISHVFSSEGEYSVRVRAADQFGAASEAAMTIGVGSLVLADIAVQPQGPAPAPATFFFDPAASLGSAALVSYHWRIEDPLNPREFTLDSPEPVSHFFNDAGTYSVLLSVSDAAGHSDTQGIDVTVSSAAEIQLSAPVLALPGENIELQVSGAAAGSVFYWDSDGNGEYDPPVAESSSFVSFPAPGDYQPAVSVVDPAGSFRHLTAELRVVAAPTAMFTRSPVQAQMYPALINFDPAGSNGGGGAACVLYWDFEGDGLFDRLGQANELVSHTYQQEGVYNATLRVVNEHGYEAVFSRAITVLPNTAPELELTASPLEGLAPLSVSFDAQVTDEGLWSLYWDFGDNSAAVDSGQHESIEHSYKLPGSYTATVTVTDSAGRSSSAMLEILVKEPPLTPRIQYHRESSDPPGLLHFDASASSSSQGSIINYAWDWDADGEYDEQSASPLAQHSFSAGEHDVALRVTDSEYNSASRWRRISTDPVSVLIVRNDGLAYPASLQALQADLNTLGLVWTQLDYSSSLLADTSALQPSAVIWYRGGPGDAGEPDQTTPWTAEEIDTYLQLLRDDTNLLLLSQNHGLQDLSIPQLQPNCWFTIYGSSLLTPAVGSGPPFGSPDLRRQHWACGMPTDRGVGWGGPIGYFPWAPTALRGDFGAHFGADGVNAAERYSGEYSSGRVPVQLDWPADSQFCASAYYDPIFAFSGALSSHFVFGLDPTPLAQDFDIGLMSYGNKRAPDENIGMYPDYSHVVGPARLWVAGYPWASLQVSSSAPAGMSRAEILQNIMAWLDADDAKVDWP
ncbi:PKD domain-containing protein [bacterium]|nr:PKD domain-containing protein [bacterium]